MRIAALFVGDAGAEIAGRGETEGTFTSAVSVILTTNQIWEKCTLKLKNYLLNCSNTAKFT